MSLPPDCLYCLIDKADAPEGVKGMAYSCLAHFAVTHGAHPADFSHACHEHCEYTVASGLLLTRIICGEGSELRAKGLIDKLRLAMGRGQA